MIERLLRSRYTAKILFLALLVAIFFVVVLRFYMIPVLASPAPAGVPGPYAQTWANIGNYLTDSGLQAAFATFLIAVLFLVLVPKEVRLGKVETISPKDIKNALISELPSTDEYYFRGRSARWFRSNVLPTIAKSARTESKTKRIYLLLPDPSNNQLLQDYADYRNSIAYRGKSSAWTVWDVQREILATLVSIGHANNENILVVPEVGMLDSYNLMRVDMVADQAVLTREDPQLPAIRCMRGSTLFDSMREEILQGISQGRKFPLPVTGGFGRPLDDSFVKDVLDSLGLSSISSDAAKVDEILSSAKDPEEPYK